MKAVNLFAAEWIKFWSLRSTAIILSALTAWYVYAAYQGAQRAYSVWTSMPPAERGTFDPSVVFRGPDWFLLMVVAGSVGALVVAGEHASGLIRTTFTAVPGRIGVATAKLAVVTVAMTGVGAVITGGSYAATVVVFHSHHLSFTLDEPGATALLASTTLLTPLCALVGMAIGGVIRNTPASVAVVCVLFMLIPLLFKDPTTRWAIDVGNALPVFSWARLTTMSTSVHVVGSGPGYAAAWTAFACWPLVSALVLVIVMRWRDV
jgi:ABC-2 type transport system permease protein